MADGMDEEMSDEPLLLQELTCPVCQGVYRNPMLLPCTHSFCQECLQRSMEVTNRCPICRSEFQPGQEIMNRALGEACEKFMNWNPRPFHQPARESLCNIHLKPLELYCEKDEEAVCVDCVSLHNTHRLWSLSKGAPICKKELGIKVQIFEKKLDLYKKTTHKINSAVEHIKHQAGQAEKQIRDEFDRLRQELFKEESQRLHALATEEDEKIAALQELNNKTKKDIVDLKEIIDTLKKEMGNEDLPLVQNFKAIKRKAQWTGEDPCLRGESLLNMGKHVGALSFKIWKSMQAHVNCNPVVFDPNTASPWLSLSEDLTGVKESAERLTVPDNLDRFEPCIFVLGAEGYTSGKHRWDIIVGDNPKWVLGVCNESVARKKKFTISTTRGVWSIGLSKGVYTALTPERTELQVQERPERIRIKLNIDRGEVSFWDGGTAKHLVTLKHKFTEKMFPFFGPGLHNTPVVLAPGKIAVHTS
ncbi:tripartite motif containing 35-28 [Halichoeres trimaculatus]|uniref:tripartite motif containing 35-28 n=1 Tax=Halichoeres trimaculatus TaxID=147232 RepID=UPI003D9E1D39